jgi:hypothetical protein
MADSDPNEPFFLIVADLDAGLFCVEGLVTDDRPWRRTPLNAQRKSGAATSVVARPVRTANCWRASSSKRTNSTACRPAAS